MIEINGVDEFLLFRSRSPHKPVSLTLSEETTDKQLVEITPHLQHVKVLRFEKVTLRFEGAQGLFASATLSELESLYLNDCVISSGVTDRFSDNDAFHALTHLYIKGVSPMEPHDWEVLAMTALWKQLRTLYLDAPGLSDEEIIALTKNNALKQFTSLTFISEICTVQSVEAIRKTRLSRELKDFMLTSQSISFDGVVSLAKHNALPQSSRNHYQSLVQKGPPSFEMRFGEVRSLLTRDLEQFSFQQALLHQLNALYALNAERYNGEVLPYLQRSTLDKVIFIIEQHHVTELKSFYKVLPFCRVCLSLHTEAKKSIKWSKIAKMPQSSLIVEIVTFHDKMTRRDIRAIGHSAFMTNLTELCLYCTLTQDAISELFVHPNFESLTSLSLPFVSWNFNMMDRFIEAPMCKTLELLELYDAGLDNTLMRYLVSAPFQNLRQLRLGENTFDIEFIDMLSNSSWFDGLRELHLDFLSRFDEEDKLNIVSAVLAQPDLKLALVNIDELADIKGTSEYRQFVKEDRFLEG